MAEPRNVAHVLGVGCEIESVWYRVRRVLCRVPRTFCIPRPTKDPACTCWWMGRFIW